MYQQTRREPIAIGIKVTGALCAVFFAVIGYRLIATKDLGATDDIGAVIQNTTAVSEPETPKFRYETFSIPEKATFGELMKTIGVSVAEANAMYRASVGVYDLAKIHAGKSLTLVYPVNAADQFGTDMHDPAREVESGVFAMPTELKYPVSVEEELFVTRNEAGVWEAKLEKIDYEVRERTVVGTVNSSLYQSGLDQGLDERAIIALANVFEWTIDFSQDVRVGDTYTFVYEELYRDGKYVMPGSVKAARYVNEGNDYFAFGYTDSKGVVSYYDEKGDSLKKMFLKAPVAFRYISSGFTTGMRYVAAFNTSTGHRAIDYAAASGTPIRATADGKVVFAGWSGPYGNLVTIRHNATYSTNYAHQSKMAVKVGNQVKQGQVIGYVGSTGFSTGPHLHYEMVKNGVKINPLRETFPSSEPIANSEREAFTALVDEWKPKLFTE